MRFQWNQFQSSFCPWNHFPYIFHEHNCFWRTSYCRKKISKFLQSIQTFHQPYKIPWTFFRRKPVSLQSICLITVHMAFPSVKWFWFLFHHSRRQFPSILLRWNTILRTFYQSSSFRLISNRFNWFPWIFFQSKRDPRNFIPCNRFPRKSCPQSFNFFQDFPNNSFFSQGLPISGENFFGSHRL